MNLNLYLEKDLYNALAEYASKHNVSKNSVIREAIREIVLLKPTLGNVLYSVKADVIEENFDEFVDCVNLQEVFKKAKKINTNVC